MTGLDLERVRTFVSRAKHAIARFAELDLRIASELELAPDRSDVPSALATRVDAYFTSVRSVAELLANMAELQRSGILR